MIRVDLNCDLGESFGNYTLGRDREILPLITSCNVACGFHASDPDVMRKTVHLACEAGTAIGAHPGFPDLMGFGRREMAVTPGEAENYVLYQLGALEAFLRETGAKLHHVKPHGALYNMAARDYELSLGICRAVRSFDPELIVVGLYGSELVRAARDTGLRAAGEVFCDRAYEDDGSLVSRRKEGAVIRDEELAVKRVIRMVKENRVTSIHGREIEIVPDTLCIHGDNEKALLFAKKIREALTRENIELAPF